MLYHSSVAFVSNPRIEFLKRTRRRNNHAKSQALPKLSPAKQVSISSPTSESVLKHVLFFFFFVRRVREKSFPLPRTDHITPRHRRRRHQRGGHVASVAVVAPPRGLQTASKEKGGMGKSLPYLRFPFVCPLLRSPFFCLVCVRAPPSRAPFVPPILPPATLSI